jgi:16S rRNA (guanine527-N7)-methyltransferase
MTSRNRNNSREDMDREISELRTGLVELGIDHDARMIRCFQDYINMLHSFHGRIHLLSNRDYQRISRRHFLPSLAAFPYVRHHVRVCDVGGGAGFPSIPLKIVLPALDLVIFESVRKKAEFLRTLVTTLRLSKIEVRNERAEDYSGAGFDLILFKAVGKIRKLMTIVDRLLVAGGESIFYKSHDVQTELRHAGSDIEKKGLRKEVVNLSTPVEALPLALVILRKPVEDPKGFLHSL